MIRVVQFAVKYEICLHSYIRVWDTATGQEVRTLQGHSDLVRSVALSPDEKTIASGSNDRTVR